MSAQLQYLEHQDYTTKSGSKLTLRTAYKTYGQKGSPAVLVTTAFDRKIDEVFNFAIGAGKALDPSRYFIIIVAQFGGGESTSPSNTPAPFDGPRLPQLTYEDNVHTQYKLLNHLQVQKLFAVVGYSMGGQQAYYWSLLYPQFVERIVVLCSAARTSAQSWALVQSLKSQLKNSIDFQDGNYRGEARLAMEAFHRVMFPWSVSAEWFRLEKWRAQKFASVAAAIDKQVADEKLDANDALFLCENWQNANISHVSETKDFDKALKSIEAKVLIIVSRTDQLFRPEESTAEMSLLRYGKLRILDTVNGHLAGDGTDAADGVSINNEMEAFFEDHSGEDGTMVCQ